MVTLSALFQRLTGAKQFLHSLSRHVVDPARTRTFSADADLLPCSISLTFEIADL